MLLDSTKPILVVDPSGDATPVLSRLLMRSGAGPIERAETGEAALTFLSNSLPSLIISEWIMKPMTGADLVRAVRREKKTAALPVMIATDKLNSADTLAAFELGVDAIAIVPLLPRDFLKKIDEIPERVPRSP